MKLHIILTVLKKNKCSGSCNHINGPYARLCVRDVIENVNVKVFSNVKN